MADRRRRRSVLAGVAFAAATLGACGDDDSGGAPSADDAEPLTGTVPTVDGAQIDLADFADADLVVWFWAPW